MQLTNNFMKPVLIKNTFQHKYTYNRYYCKTSFPITSTYTMIRHNSQGATITIKVLIYIKDAFALDLAYVMLSRVTNQTNLKIVGILTPNDFI